ncbi:MAG: hypothetical protein KIT33_12320 [Candidatus Kapabacteria bacterium]|nr:hypothetical protein [Ignavibacteriota bacterium]MCW5885746.1 hypothetical protein [Candidatus Kapabacteria bacterium]
MKKTAHFIFFAIFFISGFNQLFSQTPGGEKEPEFNPDSVFVFESPRPLISKGDKTNIKASSYGLDVILSDSGFGFGFFWQRQVLDGNMIIFSNLLLSGARNTDEFEQFINGRWQVINKINRVYKFPMTFGLQQFIFKNALSESLQPFLSLGIGPTFILSNPYTYDREPNGEIIGWFKSFGYSEFSMRFGGSVGIGAYFGNINNSILGVNIKYHYIPYGGDGIESIIGLPMTNLGGVFLSLTIGSVY